MSLKRQDFKRPSLSVSLFLPFEAQTALKNYQKLVTVMVRQKPEAFTRDEWAYLAQFIGPSNLKKIFQETFGSPAKNQKNIAYLFRPRGSVSVWLPGNVSLLGPLTLVLLSLTGNKLRLKMSSESTDLTQEFFMFVKKNLLPGPFKTYFGSRIAIERFGKEDDRNVEMSREAAVRIAFGSEAATEAISALPHSSQSLGFFFSDRRSEAWLEKGAFKDDDLKTLIKVFSIFGQAGCTSPQRVLLLGGNRKDAAALQKKLADLWPKVIQGTVSLAERSEGLMAFQLARALNWKPELIKERAVTLCSGTLKESPVSANLALMVVPCSLSAAVAALPANIQTIGTVLKASTRKKAEGWLAETRVKRIVPLAKMHHFSATWDGWDFWASCFEKVALQ